MENRNLKIAVAGLCIAAIVLGVLLLLCGNKPDEAKPAVIVGKVYEDSRYKGTFGCLDEYDFSLTQCQVVLRYAGCEGSAKVEGDQTSPWYVYVSNGKIVDQVQVDKQGVYRFYLGDWKPEGIFTGDMEQEVTVVIYNVELLVPVEGFCSQKAISSSQVRIKISEDNKVIQGPFFIVSQ